MNTYRDITPTGTASGRKDYLYQNITDMKGSIAGLYSWLYWLLGRRP